jgi:uncharacterized protein YceH (UPF0502 family)
MTPTVPIVLTRAEARVLGALVEKEVTTPDYYPLSLNALINACNQRSNREPVMDLDEEAVRQGCTDWRIRSWRGVRAGPMGAWPSMSTGWARSSTSTARRRR